MPRRLDPEAAATVMRAAGVEPIEPYRNSQSPWRCRCLSCGREVTPRYTDVRGRHAGCKWCAWRKAGVGQRLQHEIAASFMIEHGLEPLEQYPGAGKQWRCRCLTCGNEVRPRYTNIKQSWGGCGRCGRRAQSRTQRGPEARAIADFLAVGLEPLEPYMSVMTPWRSQCRNCGREVSPLLNNIRKGQGACRWCSGKAVDAEDAVAVMRAESLEPLVAYPDLRAAKIGITDASGRRLKKHSTRGWQVLCTVTVRGERAQLIEADIIDWWRGELALPAYLGPQEMPQGGWTETVCVEEVDLALTMRRIRHLADAAC